MQPERGDIRYAERLRQLHKEIVREQDFRKRLQALKRREELLDRMLLEIQRRLVAPSRVVRRSASRGRARSSARDVWR